MFEFFRNLLLLFLLFKLLKSVSVRMIPANHKYFLLSDLASSRDYELCVLAVYDDGMTALTGTKLVGCVSFSTESEYGRCHSIRDQVRRSSRYTFKSMGNINGIFFRG